MPRLRCPRCATVVDVAPGARPVCTACGFGGPASAATARAAPAASPPAAPAPASYVPLPPSPPRPSSRTGRTIAIVAAAVLLVAIVAAAGFMLLKKDAPSDLTEAEAQERVAASLQAAASAMEGDATDGDLVKVDVRGEPPADGSGSSDGFGDLGNMHLVMEWGRDGALQVKVDASNGPVTISFTMTCTKDRRAMEYGGEAYVSRPYVGGAVDCLEEFTGNGEEEAGMEEGLPPLEELDAAGAAITVNDDGSIHAEMEQDGATVTMEIDAAGRLTSMKATEPGGAGTVTMTYQYGERRSFTLPAGAKLMPAEVRSEESSDGGKRVFRVTGSPQEPPLSEMEVRVQDYSFSFGDDGDGGDAEALRFPADAAGPQTQGNYTVQYHDADGDGKVSAGDSWDLVDAAAADDPFGFGSYQEVVLYDEVAQGEVNDSPLMPGLGWLPLAGLALGLALLRRR